MCCPTGRQGSSQLCRPSPRLDHGPKLAGGRREADENPCSAWKTASCTSIEALRRELAVNAIFQILAFAPASRLTIHEDTDYVVEPATKQVHSVDLTTGKVTASEDLAHEPNEIAVAIG